MFVRVPTGPLRGMKLQLGTSIRCFKGTFEQDKALFLQGFVKPGDTVWDIGAHIGYMTLLLSKSVGSSGQVYALEPNKSNYSIARSHVDYNCKNVVLLNAALWKKSGLVAFSTQDKSLAGHIVESNGKDIVLALDLEALVEAAPCSPALIKMDVEGAEDFLIPHLVNVLPSASLALLCSIDSDQALEIAKQTAETHGMRLYKCAKFDHPNPYSKFGDAEILLLGKDRVLSEASHLQFMKIGSTPVK